MKRQAEGRLREHFTEPARAQAQAHAAIKEEDDDEWERPARRQNRIPEPL